MQASWHSANSQRAGPAKAARPGASSWPERTRGRPTHAGLTNEPPVTKARPFCALRPERNGGEFDRLTSRTPGQDEAPGSDALRARSAKTERTLRCQSAAIMAGPSSSAGQLLLRVSHAPGNSPGCALAQTGPADARTGRGTRQRRNRGIAGELLDPAFDGDQSDQRPEAESPPA